MKPKLKSILTYHPQHAESLLTPAGDPERCNVSPFLGSDLVYVCVWLGWDSPGNILSLAFLPRTESQSSWCTPVHTILLYWSQTVLLTSHHCYQTYDVPHRNLLWTWTLGSQSRTSWSRLDKPWLFRPKYTWTSKDKSVMIYCVTEEDIVKNAELHWLPLFSTE